MSQWIAVISKPGKAFRAAQQLRNQQCEVFVPECRVMVKQARQSIPTVRPLLGNYLFCLPNIPIRTLLSTYGVQSYVRKGDGSPDTIRQSVMESFMALTAVTQDMTPQAAKFFIGQRLTVKDGPFGGITGVVADVLKGELRLDLSEKQDVAYSGKIPHNGMATVRVARDNVVAAEPVCAPVR